VVPDDRSEDIHVSARSRGSAMDSDRVEVEWWVGGRGLEGRVTNVLERGRGKITGQLTGYGDKVRFEPDDARIQAKVVIRGGVSARPGQSLVAEIVGYPESVEAPIEVMLLKVLGSPDDPRTEVEKTLACADISEEFPAAVVGEVSQIPSVVQPADFHDRADLRAVPFTTIDPETARDFDDAVALEELPRGGHRLWVAVADVSHYLREGTALDHEAQARGVSVYLPNRAIPMLPEALSGHLCSLVPGEDRLAMVVRIDYDRSLAITEVDFCAAVIHSHGRLDYPGVAAALAGDVRGKRKHYEPFLPSLRTMDALARKLRVRRQERGALDLDLPQVVVELDRDDPALVRDVRRARRDPGERHAYAMIEEFMLAANEAVGDSFRDRNEDTAWRVHEVPDEEKLASFAVLAERYGIKFDPAEAATPLGLAAVLKRLRGHPAEKPLSFTASARAQASHLRRGQRGPLRPGLARVFALHLAHSPLPRRHRAPPAQAPAGQPGQTRGRLSAHGRHRHAGRRGFAAGVHPCLVLRAQGHGSRARGRGSVPRLLHARTGRRHA
jgi:ribonuclease R